MKTEAPDDESPSAYLLEVGSADNICTLALRAYDREEICRASSAGSVKAAVAAKKDPGSTRASWLHSPRETAAGARGADYRNLSIGELLESLGAKKAG